jgi:hypothetical protein
MIGVTASRQPALLYLWLSLSRRRAWHFCHRLCRPATLVGFVIGLAWAAGLAVFLFHHRHDEIFGQLVRRENLVGGALVMLGGSLFKGFVQRGLIFEPADVEFIFTSPFTQRQIIAYRLLPNYVYAILQGLVFGVLFAPHLRHPLLAAACLTLFQAVCFHLAAAAAIYSGTLPDHRYYRLRWMMLGAFFLVTALYLRVAWNIKLLPAAAAAPLAQLLFYPALTLPDATASPAFQNWALGWAGAGANFSLQLCWPLVHLGGFALAAMASLGWLFRLQANLFEPSQAATERRAERRARLQQGRTEAAGKIRSASVGLPSLPVFGGVGALFWRNLLVARRSRRELLQALVFVLIYSGFTTALMWKFHDLSRRNDGPAAGPDAVRTALAFHLSVALFIGVLGFFLQRMFPFDFRRDGRHLADFRALPVSPLALVLAEVAVPTLCVVASQAIGLAPLLIYGRFPWTLLLPLLLAYPAAALALSCVWNLHYLLSAGRGGSARAQSASAVGSLMVVALSFLVFYPAGWTMVHIGRRFGELFANPQGIVCGLAVQCAVDLLLLLALARLFERFEVSRDA